MTATTGERREPRPYLVDRRKWRLRLREAGPHVAEFYAAMMTISTYADATGKGQAPHASVLAWHLGYSESLTEHYVALGTRCGWVRRVMPDDLREPFHFRLTTPAPGYLKERWAEW